MGAWHIGKRGWNHGKWWGHWLARPIVVRIHARDRGQRLVSIWMHPHFGAIPLTMSPLTAVVTLYIRVVFATLLFMDVMVWLRDGSGRWSGFGLGRRVRVQPHSESEGRASH